MSLEIEILETIRDHMTKAKELKLRRQKDGGAMAAYEAAFWATRESGYRMILDDISDIIDRHAHEECAR